MQWLHFSDFHIGGKVGPQAEAMGSIVEFLRKSFEATSETIDAVFLVGDIAYSGQKAEYDRFGDEFLRPLLKIPAIAHARLFAVPGNHDVECDAASPVTWEGIRERNQSVYFCENHEGLKARKHRAEIFRNYWAFVQMHGIESPDPFSEVSKLYCTGTGFPVDILAINTSFFSDKDERSDQPITPCPLASMRERLRGVDRKRPMLILGHHPQNCFLSEQQKQFESLLIDQEAVYLFGHEHSPKLIANVDGTVRAIGFGASYTVNLSTNAPSPYRNSFTRCRIADKLYLNGYSWDAEVGRWDDATRSQFSSGITGSTYNGTSICLSIPLLSAKPRSTPRISALPDIPRKSPQPVTIALVSLPSVQVWRRLLSLSENVSTYYRRDPNYKVRTHHEVDGKIEIVLEDEAKRDLLICIPGASHILSAKEIESYNTRLDTEDFRSVTVLSFGKISGEARQMYVRLRARKAIEVLVNRELAAQSDTLLSPSQMRILESCDAGTTKVDLLIDHDKVHVLFVESRTGDVFRVVDPGGEVLGAAHPIVSRLREDNSSFAKMRYYTELSSSTKSQAPPEFDEAVYLQRCYSENNVMKYAALANVGLRFSDFSLDDIYIDASACEVERASSDRLNALLDDHLAAYPASDKLKAQIKQQFIGHNNNEEPHEASQAREFCQKFGAVLLTGDPGSGKTCFVKSEILAYARRAMAPDTVQRCADEWHSVHVPVMIQLSQVAAEADLQGAGLLRVASRLLERRGFSFSFDHLQDLLKQGRLALFFDGLDEIVSVEKRALVVQNINDVVTTYLPLGNRVVVTSRQAAVNVVNLLPTLRQLELQGLGEPEIRTLAGRILTLQLLETSEGVVVDAKQPRSSDSAIMRQLLKDCREKPGVARLAKNPLLLTLLVMIYANSGAPSAKRHRIYEEAIKTLASVRGRQSGHDPVSAQDLRERLGAVALSVYRKESGLLPTRAEVTEVVRTVMSRQRGQAATKVEADRFIQKVAESTGLIAFGGDDGDGDEAAVVTFMHHSFMEYFAAVGLSRELDKLDVVALVTQPRWVEILTLLAGIIGESEDIAPVLARFIGDGTGYGDVDSKFLTFALDCALECEVPSEAAVRLLSTSICKCVEGGPARCDPWVRSEIGHRLSQLISACGLSNFESTIAGLIRSSQSDVCAAAISLAGYACGDELQSTEIVKALEESCSRIDENTLCAICEAAARVKWFRTHLVLQVVAKCLKKSSRCKLSAFEATIAIPGFAAQHWPEIINGLDDTFPGVRRLASRAAIQAGLDGDLAALNDAKKDLVANALQHIRELSLEHEYPTGVVREETVDRLMRSAYLRDRLIGIQLIPAVESSADYGYRRLLKILDESHDHQEITAAIGALCASRDSHILFTVSDLKTIVKFSKTGTSDVRRASIQLLGHFGADSHAVKALIDIDLTVITSVEYAAIFASLGRADALLDDVVALIEKEILAHVGGDIRRNRSYEVEICALLDAAHELGRNLRPEVTGAVRQLIQDYKADNEVKRAALRAFAASATPTEPVVDFLVELFKNPPAAIVGDLVHTPGIFAKHCRQSVDYVIACVVSMARLKDGAVNLHQKLSKRPIISENELMISALRDGIHEVSQIIVTFEEFINPVRPKAG